MVREWCGSGKGVVREWYGSCTRVVAGGRASQVTLSGKNRFASPREASEVLGVVLGSAGEVLRKPSGRPAGSFEEVFEEVESSPKT